MADETESARTGTSKRIAKARDREARRAAAMRANLRRRKDQQRARDRGTEPKIEAVEPVEPE